MKRYLMCLMTVSLLFNSLAFAYTQENLHAVIEKWRNYPQFVGEAAEIKNRTWRLPPYLLSGYLLLCNIRSY